MRKSNNSNIFTGDRDYKTNFFLQFFSKQTEQKFRHENISRNRYSLQGFLIFSLCYHAISFMQSDCFLFGSCCHQVYLLLLTMITLIAALHFTQKKISSIYIHLLLLPTTLYQQTLFMEKYNTDTGLLIAVVSTSLTSFLVHPVWFLQAFYSLCAYCLFFIYTRLYFVQNLLRKPELDVLLDLIVYNIIALTFLAFIEKDRKERWVLLDTFKKSERIFRQIYEELPYPMFVLEKNKKVLYANSHGVSLVSNYTKNCGSCNFAKKNVFLDKMVDQASLQVLENAMSSVVSTKEAMSCYVSLQNPTETISDDSVHKVTKDNHYKLTVSPGVWKKSLVFMVALRDYSTKRKSEAVSSKAVEGLVKDVEGVIKRCESHTTDNTNQKFKLELIAQANSLKLSILNTKILFNQIFEKKEGLKEEMNFNIQKVVLASIATLNQTFRHTNCSIQLRFEPSFPQAVLGDEFLFEQIFSNALSLFLKKLNKTKVSVDCKLCSLTADGKYLLSFEFEIPKNNQLAYDPLQSHLDATRVATLDHFVDDDAILFGLALIRPGIELLEGTSELEEGQNVVCLSIKLPFKTQDNSKQTNPSLFQTFELTDYDSSSKPSLLTYYWDPVQSTRTSVILDCPREPKELGGSHSGANNSLLKKTLEESFRRGHSRTSSFEKSPGRTSLEAPYKNKFIEELQKIKTENIKNFGNVNQAQSTHSPDLSTSSTVVQNYATFEKQKSNDSNISLYIEEKKELEKDKSKKQTPKIYLSRADDMEITNYDDQSDRESVQNFLRTYQTHELNVKLALAKALASILDGHKRRGSQKSQTSELGSTLELVTLEKRMKGKWIDERKLYAKTVRYLSSKLEEEQYRERFLTFLEQDVESLRRDLEPAQEESLCALPKSLANTAEVVIENSPIPIVRRAVTSNVKEFMTFRRRSSVTSHLTPDTGRSKERSLNERFLLSPSVSRTVSISNQSRKSIFMEISKDSDSQGMSEDRKIELENKIMEKKKSEKLKRDLCPFTADKVPVALILRSHRHIRKWQSIGTSVESGATKKVFNYNDVFTILVTDDSNFVLKAVTALPLKYKTKLEFANNGTEALKKYLAGMEQGIMFHLILMDLQMPVMDGFEATRNIRDEEFSKQYPQTYICAMSAFEEADLTARVRREGINNFVQKPLRLEVLNNLIKTRCEEIGIPLQE